MMWGRQNEQGHRDRRVLYLWGTLNSQERRSNKKTEETLTLGIKATKESSQQCFGGPWNKLFLQ